MDVEAMPTSEEIRELVDALSRARGSTALRAVLLGMRNAETWCLEAADTITDLHADNKRLRVALSAFDPQRIGSGQSVDIAALTDAQRNARAALATAQENGNE